jgi:hypothetical protein
MKSNLNGSKFEQRKFDCTCNGGEIKGFGCPSQLRPIPIENGWMILGDDDDCVDIGVVVVLLG